MKNQTFRIIGSTTGIGLTTARLARLLLSGDSSYFIGENFNVDGGIRLP